MFAEEFLPAYDVSDEVAAVIRVLPHLLDWRTVRYEH
jgi:hypothetical protein